MTRFFIRLKAWLKPLYASKYLIVLIIVLIILLMLLIIFSCLPPNVLAAGLVVPATNLSEPGQNQILPSTAPLKSFQRAPVTVDELNTLLEQSSASDRERLVLAADPRYSSEPEPVTRVLQPDPLTERAFLLVSESEAAATAFNSYFSFYFDWTHERDSQPVLLIDRLFPEVLRTPATESGQFSTPLLEQSLQYWLEQLIDPVHGQALTAFILERYRLDFAARIAADIAPEAWHETCQIGPWEVTYYADRESYCTFSLV